MTDQTTAHPEQVQRLFDEKASTWAAKYAPHGRLTGRLTQLADAVGYHVAAGGRVLDLGCGSGELSRHLAAAGLRVTGCDISANMLARAAASDPAASVELVRLAPDWHTLPFASGDVRRGRGVQRAGVRPLPRRGAAGMRPGAAAWRRDAVHRPRSRPPGALAGVAGGPGGPTRRRALRGGAGRGSAVI